MHSSGGGIITHQMGHTFFLLAMVGLIFTIRGKELEKSKGWRYIRYAAFCFILWNLDTITAHFIDNQIKIVKTQTLSFHTMLIETGTGSIPLAWFYYVLKLDHILCVPAMFLLYLGLSNLVKEQRREKDSSA